MAKADPHQSHSERRSLKRFELLHRAGQELAQITDTAELQQAYETVIQILKKQFESEVVVRRFDPATRELVRVRSARTHGPERFERVGLDDPLNGRVVRERRTLLVDDADRPPSDVGSFPRSNPEDRSFLVTPIQFRESYYGNLALSHQEVNYFADADVKLIEGLAQQLAITIHRLEQAEAQREAERRAMEAETMGEIGRQTYAILHRLGNDLGLVPRSLGKIRRVLEEIGLHQPRIDQELDRALGDVRRVLDFSRALMGELSRATPRETGDHAVGALIENAVRDLKVGELAVEVDVQVAEGAGNIQVDPQQVTNALLNLLTNALEAMPEGGKLTVGAEGDGPVVRIWVRDTGRGIQPEQLERMFNLGFTTKSDGSGFGLWSVKRTVSNYGGRIEVESSPGEGTTFTLLLPRTAVALPREEPSPPQPAEDGSATAVASPEAPLRDGSPQAEPEQAPDPLPAAPKGARKILIVEDEPRWRRVVGEVLQGDGYEVETATSREEAETKLVAKSYDLLILDLRLSDEDASNEDGMEILRNLPQGPERPEVIILSAHGSEDQLRRALRSYGVADFIPKGQFDDEEFLDEVRRLFSERLTVNRDLELYWQGGSGAPQAAAALKMAGVPEPGDRSELASELEDLLRKLFSPAQSVMLKKLAPGRSGAGVLWAQPFLDHGGGQPVVVKFGDHRQIEEESHNFQRYVQPFVGGGRSTTIQERRRTRHLGGIVYSLLGAGGRIGPFAQFYREAGIDAVQSALRKLFGTTCGAWYENPGRLGPLDLAEHYRQWLGLTPEALEASFAKLRSVQGQERLYFEGLDGGRSFPNPLPLVDGGALTYSTYQTLTHGDFNPHNIFVDEHGDAWLIDFGRTGRGHLLRDAVQLDTVIRLELLAAEEATLEERLLLEEALCEAGSFLQVRELRYAPATSNPAVGKAFAVCKELRRIAGGLVKRVHLDIQELYTGAVFCALSRLCSPDLAPVQREHALLSACVMAERLAG